MPPLYLSAELIGALFALILGSLIGSFANVVIHRLPRGESIAFPGSHCPACNHRLGPAELVPVLSWLVQGGRCRSCSAPISLRYPAVEVIFAVGFALLWLVWPPTAAGWSFIALATLFSLLVILAAVDLDTFSLPDILTIPGIVVALLATLLYPQEVELPTLSQALLGAGVGAGILALVNRLGALAMRRFGDTAERSWPLGFDQVNLAALAGALAGVWVGLATGALSLLVNLVSGRSLRIPEPILFTLWALALLLAFVGSGLVSPAGAIAGSVASAGALAVSGGIFWWLRDWRSGDSSLDDSEGDDEPVAMGFGDVKLAALMGAMLGWEKLLLALFLSFLLGAVGGIIGRLAGGDKVVPFGPYLVVATLLTLFLGEPLLDWYLGLLAI